MHLILAKKAIKDFEYWRKNDKKILKKITILLEDIIGTPFEGKGKPEPLKHELSGCWSRRINSEHRLIYKVENDIIYIIRCRFHYE